MSAGTRGSILRASTWFGRQRRRARGGRARSVAARFAGEKLEDRTLLSSINTLIGVYAPLPGSKLVLDLPSDPAKDHTFHALSSDASFGTLDSGIVKAAWWDYSATGTSKRLNFQGTGPDDTTYLGNISLAPAVSGYVDIDHNGLT